MKTALPLRSSVRFARTLSPALNVTLPAGWPGCAFTIAVNVISGLSALLSRKADSSTFGETRTVWVNGADILGLTE